MTNYAATRAATLIRFTAAGWTLAAIIVLGFNLRPAVSGLGPILAEVSRGLGLSGALAGILTTLPVVFFGAIGPFAPGLAHRFGTERVIFASMVLLAIGTAIRALGGEAGLFLGMAVAGLSIGAVNVLLPAVIKQDFPGRIGVVMGLYTCALCVGAGVSALATPPFERWVDGGWRAGLAIWAAPALLSAVLWLPQLAQRRPTNRRQSGLRHPLWRNALAWQVTANLTVLTALAYVVFAWGPKLLQDRGMSVEGSAEIIALSVACQAASSFVMPVWAARRRTQRLPAVIAVLLALAGLLGFVFAPLGAMPIAAVLCGLGQGGAFGIALALIALRAGSAESAAQLSGMAQTVCYIVGGLLGPFAVGLIHDWSQGWTAVGGLFVAVYGIGILTALGAGRDTTVEANAK